MQKQNLVLHNTKNNCVRTIIKTKHARLIYLKLRKAADKFTVENCFYIDRIRCGEYYAVPQKLITLEFSQSIAMDVIARELDRQYYGIDIVDDLFELSTEEFIKSKLNQLNKGYKFLIFVGKGVLINGLPSALTTRLANKIHRKIYLKISYYKNGLGVIEDCHYYDRKYKTKSKVIPQMLTTIFVNYDRKTIIDVVNRELDCDFTDIIIADENIDVEKTTTAICGNV